jgi:methionyl-tRNA formyltransferase
VTEGEGGSSARAKRAPPPRTVFLGSGAFAVPVLAMLARHPRATLAGVVTSPRRPAGRGQEVLPSPVAAWYEEQAAEAPSGRLPYPLLEPRRLRAPEAVAMVRRLQPELIVLADYGQIVPAELLELPRHGALNLHPSLLPRHRGATPVPAAILAADEETGVSLIRMDAGIDSGPILAIRRHPLRGDETAPELEAELAARAAELLRRSLKGWLEGRTEARPQPSEGVTMTRPLRREDGRLDPGRSADELARQVRAYQPWPGSFVETPSGRLVIWAAEAIDAPEPDRAPAVPGAPRTTYEAAPPPPGSFLADGEGVALAVTGGALRLLEVQPAGGRRMSGAELRRGRPGLVGSRTVQPALG